MKLGSSRSSPLPEGGSTHFIATVPVLPTSPSRLALAPRAQLAPSGARGVPSWLHSLREVTRSRSEARPAPGGGSFLRRGAELVVALVSS